MSGNILGDEALQKLERTRLRLIEKLAPNENVSDDLKTNALLLQAIDGGTRTILSLKKIEAAKEAGNKAVAVQQQIADILRTTVTTQQKLQGHRENLPDVPDVQASPGEDVIGTLEVKYREMVGPAS